MRKRRHRFQSREPVKTVKARRNRSTFLCRCEELLQLNACLKDQLEESHHTNDALTNDLQKLSNDWDVLREELAIKEDEWKEEEQAFNEYYITEHNRLLNLWRDVVSVKRLFAEMKSTTQRDLSKLQNDISSLSSEMTSMCNSTNLIMKLQASTMQSTVRLYFTITVITE